jgi:hypothetical protein
MSSFPFSKPSMSPRGDRNRGRRDELKSGLSWKRRPEEIHHRFPPRAQARARRRTQA